MAMSSKSKENSLFSLVPRGVPVTPNYRPPPVAEFEPISNPDSFSDFFRLLGEPHTLHLMDSFYFNPLAS